MNLAQHLNRFYQDLGEPNTNTFGLALVKEWFDEAEDKVNKKAKTIHSESVTDILAWNDTYTSRLYSFPSDLLDFNIDDIYISENGDVNDRQRLTPATIEELNELDRLWKTRKGTANYWFLDKINNKWGTYRHPSNLSTLTNMIRIAYRAKHTKMTRYYTTGTVSINNGSATLTGSGTTFTGNVSVGDKIGIGKLLDRTTAFPTTWYTVLTVDSNTQITLSTNFAEANQSGASYIACAPSTILFDELNRCTILFAMGLAKFKDRDFDMGAYYEEKAEKCLKDAIFDLEYDAVSKESIIPMRTFRPPRSAPEDYGMGIG
jgi:hypothetical protein